MRIMIQYLGITVNTKVLSGGEQLYLKQLVGKSDRGGVLSIQEKSFIESMASRSNHFVSNY